MTRYVLCRHALGQSGEVEISEAEYLGLAADIKTLVELSDAEEKYNAFIDNYFELEKSSLEETLRAMIYEDSDTARISDPRNLMNRRIVNFLTTVKLYLDSFPQHANILFPTGEELENLKAAPSRAFDRSISYRVMEALRNYSQHEAFPVHSWEVNFWKDTKVEPMLFRASINPSLNLTRLSESKKFKKATLEELVAAGGPTELKPIIREYVEQLCIVHAEFRAATNSILAEAMRKIGAARDKFLAQFPGSKVSVVALPVNEEGIKAGDPVYLNAHVVDYLPYLVSRVGSMVNYSRRRVQY